jgi:hypothetical protein
MGPDKRFFLTEIVANATGNLSIVVTTGSQNNKPADGGTLSDSKDPEALRLTK